MPALHSSASLPFGSLCSFNYRTAANDNEEAISLMHDLIFAVQTIMRGDATITRHASPENKGTLWEIHISDEKPIVMLEYKTQPMFPTLKESPVEPAPMLTDDKKEPNNEHVNATIKQEESSETEEEFEASNLESDSENNEIQNRDEIAETSNNENSPHPENSTTAEELAVHLSDEVEPTSVDDSTINVAAQCDESPKCNEPASDSIAYDLRILKSEASAADKFFYPTNLNSIKDEVIAYSDSILNSCNPKLEPDSTDMSACETPDSAENIMNNSLTSHSDVQAGSQVIVKTEPPDEMQESNATVNTGKSDRTAFNIFDQFLDINTELDAVSLHKSELCNRKETLTLTKKFSYQPKINKSLHTVQHDEPLTKRVKLEPQDVEDFRCQFCEMVFTEKIDMIHHEQEVHVTEDLESAMHNGIPHKSEQE